MIKNETIESGYREFKDAKTGAKIHQLTGMDSIQHSLFFLNPSFRGMQGQVAIVSHKQGFPQLLLFDFADKSLKVLTDRDDMQAFSGGFSPDNREMYFTSSGGSVYRMDMETLEEEELCHIDGAGLGECSISHDGKYIVTACKKGDKHGVVVVDIQAHEGKVIHETDMKVIHPQFHPADSDIIEYAGDPCPRLWLIRRDGSKNENVYPSTDKEFYVHESFCGQSDDLIFAIWPYRLCRLNIHERKLETIAELNAWHMASSRDGKWIVSDTNHPDRGLLLINAESGEHEVICYPEATSQGFQWKEDHPAGDDVWRNLRGEDGKALSWMEMKADNVYGPQWTHPHPAFNDEGTQVVYTSDVSGQPQVYVVEIEK